MQARIFPRKTNLSPQDRDAYFGPPDLFTPRYKKALVSVAFTWDIPRAKELAKAWELMADKVTMGGPAIDGESDQEFTPGLFLKPGALITSRGCPNRCPHCFIRQPLRELKIKAGNDILDNNILACSRQHLDRLFEMLASQHGIRFTGGLEARLVTPEIVDRLRGLRISDLFLAFDQEANFPAFERAAKLLARYFNREKLHAYVLVGKAGDTIPEALDRLERTWALGVMPFAMLYRPTDGSIPEPRRPWMKLHKEWSRPAIIKYRHKPMIKIPS